MPRILITGSNGFVGTNLFRKLNQDYSIYGLDININGPISSKNMFSWDNIDDLPDVDNVIHLAGKAHDTKNKSEKEVYFDINTELTKKIYDWFLKSLATRFIFFSSVKAAADSVDGDILYEDVVPTPVGPYGESKIAAENYILANLPKDKHVYILRPCMIHGPGNKGNLNLLHKVVSKGIPWPLGAFENQRSFCSIDNLSFVIKNLMEKDIPTGIYQVADDTPISTNKLFELIAHSLDKKPSIWNINQPTIKFFTRVGDVLHLPLNTQRLKKLTESYVVSNEKIKAAIGITNMPVSSEEGMRRTLESFKGD